MATLQYILERIDPTNEDLRLIMQAKLADPKFSVSVSQRKSLKNTIDKIHFFPPYSPQLSPQPPQVEVTDVINFQPTNKEDLINTKETKKNYNAQILTALNHQKFSIDGFFALKHQLTVNSSKFSNNYITF
jgi:hypothetical protein